MSNDKSDLPEVFDSASRNIVSRVVDLRVNKTDLIDLVIGEVAAEFEEEVLAAEDLFEKAKASYMSRVTGIATRHFRGLINQLQKHARDGLTIRLSLEERYVYRRNRRNATKDEAVFAWPTQARIRSYTPNSTDDDDEWDSDSAIDVHVDLPEASEAVADELREVIRLGHKANKLREQFNNLDRQSATVKRQMTRTILESTQDGLAVLEQLAGVRKELKSRIRNPEKKIKVA